MRYTDNYNMKKPELDEYIEIDDLNENFDAIDERMKVNEDKGNDNETSINEFKDSKGQSNGIASLDSNRNVPEGQLGNLPDNLETTEGAQRKANTAEQNANQYTKQKVDALDTGVTEVNGKTGSVELKKSDIELGNVDDVQQASKTEFENYKEKSVTRTTSSTRPTGNNDTNAGFKQGDVWIYENYVNEEEYEYEVYTCLDAREGAAKWELYADRTQKPQLIYGVRVDENNSNPDTRVTYIGDAAGFTPMSGNDGNLSFGSWEPHFKDLGISPVVLQNSRVNYYLDPDNYNRTADGNVSDLTGGDGDVMVEFGKTLWYKWTNEGGTYTIEISNQEFDGAVKYAFEVEDGYNIVPYYPLFLTQMLFVVLFKSTDSQTALGRGRVDGAGYISTGNTDDKGMFYGSESDEQMKFLGMEDYWGNKNWWIDGLVTDSNHDLLIGNEGFNDDGSGYKLFDSGMSSNEYGYIDEVQGGNDKGFITRSGNGSSSTYYADNGTLISSRVPNFGGSQSFGSNAGFARLRLYDSASSSSSLIGARLFCAANGKIYIGAYLGTVIDGRLRSVSGASEPTDNMTIGEFRKTAQANN